MFKKLFTAAWIALMFACCQLAAAATTVSVTATPSNPTAPANVTLAITATSDSGPVMATQVEYFNGTTSLGIAQQAPFTLAINDLAAGTYQITAKVTTTDPDNPVVQSPPLALTVGTVPGAANAYFIHTDQINTPRAITNANGAMVWQWDSDPFGKEAANEQPAGQPAFTSNQRFPGQQFDRESNLHYNYFRDYDPTLGRYIQSDPIGLKGGVSIYAYVDGQPLIYFDLLGLEKFSMVDPKDSPLISSAASADFDISGTLIIYAHANPETVADDRGGRSNRIRVGPEALAEIIRRSGKWKPGMPIEMRACESGKGENSIAQRLSLILKTKVAAPDTYYYFGERSIGPYDHPWYSKGADFGSPGKMQRFNGGARL